MKHWLYGLGMCQSMFCAIPFPWHGWDEEARDRMLLCLPLIGLEIGLLWAGLNWLCAFLEIPPLLRGAAAAAAPYLLTGFMHLDGFMDVTDAVRSYRSLERRREILKDSHVGSFAVIGVALVLIAQFAAAATLEASLPLVLIPVVSRCCSVLAVLSLPPMTTSQYADMPKNRRVLPWVMLAVTLLAGACLGLRCFAALAATAAAFALALRRAYQSLQGMNGDISGYSLTLAELAGLVAACLL